MKDMNPTELDTNEWIDPTIKRLGKEKARLTRGGPGDKSTPGNVDTSEWWQDVSKRTKETRAFTPIKGIPVKDKTLIQKAKDKDIFFCTIPFTQAYSEMNGRWQACCFAHAPMNGPTVEDTTIKEWMEDSSYMNSIRKEMTTPGSDLRNVKKWCQRCVSDEERYGRSRRTNCLKIHTNNSEFWDDIQKSVDLYEATGKWTFFERIIEVQLKIFGSECNLDCHMCIHTNSTVRQAVAKKGVWSKAIWEKDTSWPDHIINFKTHGKDRTKGTIEQVLELAPYIRSIKIIGGEPLIMKKHYEMMEKIVKSGHADKIFVKYQTNMTKTKTGRHSIFDYVPYFKEVAMVGSVDGVGKTIEYIRRRTNWKELVENIEECKKYPNVVVDFNGLVSFLSVMRFYEVIDYVKQNPNIFQINWAMLETPIHLRPNNLPEPIKQKLIPKYEDYPDIVAALERPMDPGVNIQDIFQYLLKQDKHYEGTKWEMHLFDVFPELKEYYDPNYKEIT
jgi:organic radical activating enzyme